MLFWLVWILAILSIVFGVIGIVKKQSMAKCIIGIVLSVFAFAAPSIFSEQFAEKGVESVSNAVEFVNDHTNAFEE